MIRDVNPGVLAPLQPRYCHLPLALHWDSQVGQSLLFPSWDTGVPATHSHSGQDPPMRRMALGRPHTGALEDLLEHWGIQVLPEPKSCWFPAITCYKPLAQVHHTQLSWLSTVTWAAVLLEDWLVQLGKMPNHLVFYMKVSLQKNSQERRAMLVFHPALLLCLSFPGRMLGNWEAVFAARLWEQLLGVNERAVARND